MTRIAGGGSTIAAGGAALVAAAAYAWWATGLRPFQTIAYVSVAIPVAAVAVGALALRRPAPVGATHSLGRGWLPWLVLLLAAAGLEAAGLAVGGRSATLPTLSDTVDHLLRWHGARLVIFLVWLALGRLILTGARRRTGAGA